MNQFWFTTGSGISHIKITHTNLDGSPLIQSKYMFSKIFVISGAVTLFTSMGKTMALEFEIALCLWFLSDHCI